MSVGDVTHHLVEKVPLTVPGDVVRWTGPPDWTFRPAGQPYGLPAPLPQVAPRPVPEVSGGPGGLARISVGSCDCGRNLDSLLKVLGLPEGLRGLVLAVAAAPDADPLDVLADYLEERMDPRAGRFRELAARARGGKAP
jgi:hypothetical protein